jgi:hypothetical protein
LVAWTRAGPTAAGQERGCALPFERVRMPSDPSVSTGLKGNHFRRFCAIQFRQRARRPTHRPPPRQARVPVDECFSYATRSGSGQASTPGAPNRRGNVETRRTRSLSRASPMPGLWSLVTHPSSYRPLSPGKKQQAFSPHSVGTSVSRNRRSGDCLQMMVRGQEKWWRASLSATRDDYPG